MLKLGDGAIQAIAQLPHVGTALSGVLKVLLPLKYHPHVLDAWVTQHLATATTKFTSPTNKTVSERAIHVPLPVQFNEHAETEFGPQTLRPYFQKSRFCLLLTGEGGAGKTSLACQIARWGLERKLAKYAILPILIEQELGESDNLLAVIQGYLETLVAAEGPLDKTLVEALLRKRRLLVIVDHLSEMAGTTRGKIRPADPNFPIHALIVTSRLPEEQLSKDVVLEPMRVEGNRLSEFINAYLTAKGKRHLFEDEDYFEVCRRLSRMVGQRTITVLLARLYTDQTIEQQEGAGGTLPDSIPELMLSYLNQLNRTIEPANQRDRLQVQQDAQVIAWKCLERTYRPIPVERAGAIAALVAQGMQPDEANQRLKYLEERLRLLQTLEPGTRLRIMLDPLAEYLAANWLVHWFQAPSLQTAPDFLVEYLQGLIESQANWADPQEMWRLFFDSIDQKLGQNETSEAIQGFLLAVCDCHRLTQKAAGNPDDDEVSKTLTRKAGLDPEDLRQAQEKRRIRLLISELSAPELKFRIRAAEDLAQLGASARMAAPNLIGMLENRNQTLEARQVAAQTLGKLGIGANNLLTVLTDPTDELAVRRSAAAALGWMKAGKAELLQILNDQEQPLPIRQGAARALSLIGGPSGNPVPMLIVTLQAGQVNTQVKSILVSKERLTDDLTLDLVAIPAGEFLMGSPAEEEGRDWYKYSFPELEGVDVEAQHRVTVPAFAMSQFPITQAQWRFVAGLPPIERDLEPDPASFKGDDRPVEVVSWREAMEFCARLSQYTGNTYRLPSEAEWEYACRGGTTTPFHFGETLLTDLANYNGTYTYGDGIQGEYRQRTTEVGSFGVVNAFGLSDMHGNVWEWCLDIWHPSYEGAPTDGSA
ncbi:MAG: SUMF1/EgtB/PvdO family nonheme iron enzyme [Leptodesmis sp.]|uniref:SUMF1/EgtB/PvdO family nonheme iron enzyme n=1 Tax=Leptodesmis sp. TaxID=3100501 RepID=UPI003D0BD9FD